MTLTTLHQIRWLVTEKFRAEQKAEKTKERIAKSVATKKKNRIEAAKETVKSGR